MVSAAEWCQKGSGYDWGNWQLKKIKSTAGPYNGTILSDAIRKADYLNWIWLYTTTTHHHHIKSFFISKPLVRTRAYKKPTKVVLLTSNVTIVAFKSKYQPCSGHLRPYLVRQRYCGELIPQGSQVTRQGPRTGSKSHTDPRYLWCSWRSMKEILS